MKQSTKTREILARAAERARSSELDYGGAVTPEEAWAIVTAGEARLIDVRTRFEWEWVGHVPGTIQIEWKQLPAMEVNPQFLPDLGKAAKKDEVILLLCRSGIRSHAAAVLATQAGFRSVYNILGGFEGDLDENQQRGKRGGWRKAGLPWVQG